MTDLVSYRFESPVATITLDDGKVNALSLAMLTAINRALDQAAADHAVVVLTGRPGVLSAGFDLTKLRGGGEDAAAMVRAGMELSARLLAFPEPVVVACTGHAIAMAAFVLLSADYRLGAAGSFRITANEVAIGLTMPHTAIEICRQRLAPAYLHRAVLLSEVYAPDDAVAAGFLDRVVPAGELAGAAHDLATKLATLDRTAHTRSKLRLRGPALEAIRRAIEADNSDFRSR